MVKVLVFDTETTGLPPSKWLNKRELEQWPYMIQLAFIIYDTSNINSDYKIGDTVIYMDSQKTYNNVTILGAHKDDPNGGTYYTIKLPSGLEKQTVSEKLRPQNQDNNIIYKYNNIIKINKSITISDESFKVHGISHRVSERKGVNILDALKIFKLAASCADIILGHNVDFDINIINAECMRNELPNILMNDRQRDLCEKLKHKYVCTMNWTREWLNIKVISQRDGEEYIRFPTLNEVHEKIFGQKIDEKKLHDAYMDTIVCLRCYIKLTENKDIGLIMD